MVERPIIREMVETDIPAVTQIQADAVVDGVANFELVPLNETQMAEKINVLKDKSCPLFVAEMDGIVAGFAMTGPYRSRPAYRWTVENSLYVSTKFQRCGLGSALLAKIIEKSGEAGFHQMVAIIGDSANTSSIELHKKHGFKMTGTLYNVGFKHGVWLDTVIMQLTLEPGN